MNKKLIYFFAIIVVILIITGAIAFKLAKDDICKKENRELTFSEWFNGYNFSHKSILVGMGSGIAFGFIDNFGLFYGMNILEKYLAKLPGGNYTSILGAYGNTFSNTISTFLSTFVGNIIMMKSGITATPIWSNAIGVIIGCLIGISLPTLVFKTKLK